MHYSLLKEAHESEVRSVLLRVIEEKLESRALDDATDRKVTAQVLARELLDEFKIEWR